jgi:hypothetical protein
LPLEEHLLTLALAGAAWLLSACSTTTPQPLRSAGGFSPVSMDTVYVLPVVDARTDKKLDLKVDQLQKTVTDSLKRKRYDTVVLSGSHLLAGLTDEDLRDPTHDWIGQTGPSEARWMMLLVVTELSRKLTFGSTGNAEVSLAILDRHQGTVVWEDKALGRAGQGGLLGMMLVSTMDDEALATAVRQVMHKIPSKPKRT